MHSSHVSSTSLIHIGANDPIRVGVCAVKTAGGGEVFVVTLGDYPVEVKLFLHRHQLPELLCQVENSVRAVLDEQHPDATDADRDTSDPFAPVP